MPPQTKVAALDRPRAAPPAPSPARVAEDWRILRALSVYRLILAALLLALHLSQYEQALFDHVTPWLFHAIAIGYAVVAVPLLGLSLAKHPRLPAQLHLHFLIDVVALISLVYACGGVESGIAMLLITPVVTCSLILPTRAALFNAAIATLLIFGEELFRQQGHALTGSESTAAGILGLIFFATATAGNAIARRARRSEALAEHASSELAELLQLNSHIVETMETGVLTVEADGHVRLSNASARHLLGVGAIDGQVLAAVAPGLGRCLANWRSHQAVQDEVDGVLPRFMALEDASGPQSPTLILLDDAALLRQRAQQLKLAALGQLTANIAHEIRNPLSAIGHASQLLAESRDINADDRALVAVMERQSRRLDKIVTDILSLSRSGAAKPETIELRGWLQQCIQLHGEMHPSEACPINAEGVSAGLRVEFDSHHLQRILHNLWNNGMEHGRDAAQAAAITLTAGRLPNGRIYLDSRDNGAGVPADIVEHIFEPFFTTARSGTGLGLYIARELCEYNRARLQHVTGTGHGCFRIVFPPDLRPPQSP
ncbi:MAG TPA: ATP-binding protein [Nevskiaceae bacterium]